MRISDWSSDVFSSDLPGNDVQQLIAHLRRELPASERQICRVLGQHRSTQRKVPRGADDEQHLTEDIIALAKQYGRYGYRRVTALLRHAGWTEIGRAHV